jgi:hypothetical protein
MKEARTPVNAALKCPQKRNTPVLRRSMIGFLRTGCFALEGIFAFRRSTPILKIRGTLGGLQISV